MSTNGAKTFAEAAKTISFYIVFEFAAVGLISILFSIPPRRLVIPFVLYLLPGVFVVPLLFNARRYFERPKTCAIVFAIALAVFGLLITVATIYSGSALGLFSADTAKDIPFIAAFGCTIMGATAYHLVLRRLTAKQPPSTPV